jgi:hypothetical protein
MKAPVRAASFAVGALALAAAVPTALGSFLPVDHIAVRSEWFALRPERLWQLALAEVEAQNDGTYTIARREEPHVLVTELAPGKKPFDGTWTYEFLPAASGTTLRITETGNVHPPFFRFVSRYVLGHTRSLDDFLAGLRARAAV